MEENPLQTELQTLDDGHNVSMGDGHNVSVDDGHNVSVDDGHNVSVDDGQNVSVDDGHNVSVDDGHNVSVDDGQNWSVDDGQNVSVNDGQNVSVDDGHNVSVDDGHNVSVDNRHNVSVDNRHNVSVDDGHNVSVDDGHNVSVDDGQNLSVDDGQNVSVNDGQNVSVDDGHNVSVDDGQNVSVDDRHNVSVDDGHNVSVDDGHNVSEDDGQNMSTAERFYRDLDARDLTFIYNEIEYEPYKRSALQMAHYNYLLHQFKLNPDELDDLQSAVHECILQILDRVVKIDDRFKCKEVIRVGSFAEGTKILAPDEFDYLVVIDELSKPGVVNSVRCGEKLPGYMTLQIADWKTQERWLDYCEDGHLLGFVFSSSQNRKKNKLSKAVGFSSLIQQVKTNQCKEHGDPILISKPSCTLKLDRVYARTDPNTVISMQWFNKGREFEIKADLSPAVRCYNVTEAVNEEDCDYTDFYTKIQEHGSYLLTPGMGQPSCPKQYFRISLTEVEVDIVQSLDTTHKTCYRVLKYIFSDKHDVFFMSITGIPFSSYVLKSAVLHHVTEQCQSSEVHTCVESVLYYLFNYLMSDTAFMPSVFIKSHNLFEKVSTIGTLTRDMCTYIVNVQYLMTLLDFTQKLCKIPKENYDYASTIKMLENTIQDFFKNKKYLYADGNRDITGMSTIKLLDKYILQEEQRADYLPC